MAKPLDPKKIESARQFSSRAERREQRRKLMQDEIAENQRSNGVIVIPPKKLQEVQQERPKLRVAAYCRVSTQEEEQVGSFDMQVRHFTQRIESNPDWELVEIYQDEGISATTVKNALAFKNDCRCGGRQNRPDPYQEHQPLWPQYCGYTGQPECSFCADPSCISGI